MKADEGRVAIASLGLATVLGFGSGSGYSTAAADQVVSGPAYGSGQAQVTSAVHHDLSAPLRQIRPSGASGHGHPAVHHAQSRTPERPARDTSGHSAIPRIPSPNTNANGIGANGSAPPDADGAAGTTQYVELVNSELAVYSKTGTPRLGPEATNTLWSGFGGGCQANNDGDGTILFDTLAQRWVIQQFSISTTPYLDCVAVSTTADATGSYYRYSFQYANFPDYPKTGVWPDAYYASFNLYDASGTTGLGSELCAFNRAAMLNGAAATQQCFMATTSGEHTFLPASLDGTRAPPAAEPEWFVGLSPFGGSALGYYRFHVDWGIPTNSALSAEIDLPVTTFSQACAGGTCIPQSGTRQRLDSLGDRLMYRLAYRNFGDHEAMVVNHSITAGSSVGVRWYELRPSGSALSVFQQGTYAPDSSYRWMGSVAMDQSGDMALGYSVSSSSLHPGIRYTGRLVGDAAGTMPQGESTIITGSGSQTGRLSRWGDYSEMTVDPIDDCTFWYVNEYLPNNGSFNWSTRFASFKFSGCGGTQSNDFSISASPSSVSTTPGQSVNTTIATTVISGSAQTVALSATGLPAGANATFNPGSVTAGASSTLTITTASSTPTGTSTVMVTGTGASATHSTTVTLTVNPTVTNDFSISASPSTVTVTQGSSGTSTISTAVTSGSAQNVSLSASGLPTGATASFNPGSVNAGGSSTMTITTSPSTPAGTPTVTVTGTGTSATHLTSISLVVNAASGPVVANGGFESGDFSGWTTGGVATAVVSPGHTGSYAARLGSTSPTNGDSTMQQTIAVPSGGGTLTLWYQPHCPDTLTYDQEQVQIRSTSGSTLATLLNVCSNSGAWTQLSSDLGAYAGQSVEIWFNSHDDNYAADPTYTLFDDIAVTAPQPPPPNRVANGGFETGSFTSWTTSGAATSVVTPGHTGTYAARLGSTSPTNGNSTVQQTISVPSTGGTLTFWYQPHCPDTLTYDQEQMQIRNTSGSVLATVLNVCSNSGAWTQVTQSMAAYAGQTVVLWFNSHDDNYAGDPTYTLFDDVNVH